MRKEIPKGNDYDKKGFYWAVMHKKQISVLYPRGREAQREVFRLNLKWEKLGWGKPWYVKRFIFYFRGIEIDARQHDRFVQGTGGIYILEKV